MRLSIFTTCTDPIERQDPFVEAMKSYLDLADEVVLVDGSYDYDKFFKFLQQTFTEAEMAKIKVVKSFWPQIFAWPFIGRQFQKGYEACTGDWAIHADLDYIFHEDDVPKIRQLFESRSDQMAFSFWKYQFLLVDRYNIKSRTVLAVNKAKFGKDIIFNAGGDMCQPSHKGKEIKAEDILEARIPFYNYDFCFKNLDVIQHDWKRFRAAWLNQFGTDFGDFKDMMKGRWEGRGWQKIPLEAHPKYIQKRIKEIQPNQFGYNMFDWISDKVEYAK